ncbi:preprotein translocase subunit SecG [Candidatus Daviesbacteria bacterium]|nr:preprotein translocase subunit SecG [Candidatus Daviesbacteria bacterium]
MNNLVLSLTQIVLAIIMTGLILLQSKGTGLGSTFGGDLGFYGTKRGAEKILFITTIVIAALFLLSLILGIFFG